MNWEPKTQAGSGNDYRLLFAQMIANGGGMYMNSIQEVQPQICPDHGVVMFRRWPTSAHRLMEGTRRPVGAEGAARLWMIGKHLDPAHRVLWLNDVAIALQHGLPLNYALALAGHMARARPLWKRRAE